MALPKSCFICSSPSTVSDDNNKLTWGILSDLLTLGSDSSDPEILVKEEDQLSYQERQQQKLVLAESVFVISTLFRIPHLVFLDKNNAPIVGDGGSIQRIGFCSSCNESVASAMVIYRDLLKALKGFRRIQLELVRKVKLGRRSSVGDVDGEVTDSLREVNSVLGKWRQFIFNREYEGFNNDPFPVEDLLDVVTGLANLVRSSFSNHPVVDYVDYDYAEEADIDSNNDQTDNDAEQEISDINDAEAKDGYHYDEDSIVKMEEKEELNEDDETEAEWKPEDMEEDSLNFDHGEEPINDSNSSDEDEEYTPKRKRGRPKGALSKKKSSRITTGTNPKGRGVFKCTEKDCSTTFSTEKGLKAHIRIKHPPDPATFSHNCETCNEKFRMKKHLNDHIAKEHPELIFRCHLCQKISPDKRGLNVHLAHSHGIASATRQKRFVCPEEGCDKIYRSYEGLKVHISKHKGVPRFKCKTCEETFWSWQQLKRHEEIVHVSGQTGTGKAFVCELCGQSFSCGHYLMVHKKVKHQEGGTGKEKKVYQVDRSPVICELCGKTFSGKHALQIHHRVVHERKYTHFCEVCGKGFFAPVHLKDHLYRIHKIGTEANLLKITTIDNIKYRCNVVGCRAGFRGDKAEDHYKKHMKKFHGEDGKSKLFKCEECGKDFADRYKFIQHELIHKNKETKPIKCETCGKGFANRVNLRYHQLNTHKAPKLIKRKKETRPRSYIRANVEEKLDGQDSSTSKKHS